MFFYVGLLSQVPKCTHSLVFCTIIHTLFTKVPPPASPGAHPHPLLPSDNNNDVEPMTVLSEITPVT